MMPAPVPFIDLAPMVELASAGAVARWAKALARAELVGGPAVRELEDALARRLGTAHAVACSNGSDALLLALQATGVRPGDHVALPNLTFWATYEAVAQLGAVPVLIDVDPDELQLDIAGLGRAFDRAPLTHVVAVHLFGWASARLGELRALCRERGAVLVEDGAQAFGVARDGVSVFAEAQIATLSMYPAKVLGGCMDSGAVLMGDPELARLVRSLGNHGRRDHYSYDHVGWNSRMGSAAAHYLLELLPHAETILVARRAAAAAYRAAASRWRAVRAFGPPPGVEDNGYLCVLACAPGQAEVYARHLAARGIGSARTYPETIDQQRPASGRFVAYDELRVSRELTTRLLNLPLYYGITEEQQARVIAACDELWS